MFRFLLLFVLFLALPLTAAEAEDFRFRMNSVTDPDSQGFAIRNCSVKTMKSAPDRLVLVTEPGKRAELSSARGVVDSNESGFIEFRMKIRTPGKSPEAVLEWKWDRPRSVKIPLHNDGEFHTYRAPLPPDRPEKPRNAAFTFAPCVTPGLEAAEVELEYLWIGFTDEAEIARYRAAALRRFTAMNDLLNALDKHKIPAKGLRAKAEALNRRQKELAAGKRSNPELLAAFEALDRDYQDTYVELSLCRRILEQQEEAEAMENTAKIPSSATYSATLNQAKQALAQGNYAEAKRCSEELDSTRTAVWGEILKENPWQSGLDRTSFGRFGWFEKGCTFLTHSQTEQLMSIPTFGYADKTAPMFQLAPVGASPQGGRECKEITWVSMEYEREFREQGKRRFWNVRNSLLAPGTLYTTDVSAVLASLNTGYIHAPGRIAGEFGGRIAVYARSEFSRIPWSKLSQNWLLLIDNGDVPEFPVLLTLQKKPERVELTERGLLFHRKGGVGTVGASFLFGVAPQPAGFASGWKTLPEPVARQVRRLNGIMLQYPWKCEEQFRVDREQGFVEIRNRVEHLPIANDWNLKGAEETPLPPLLVFAADSGYPLGAKYSDTGLLTVYGRYCTAPGKELVYRLEIPDLRNRIRLNTPGHAEEKEEIDNNVQDFWFAKLGNWDSQVNVAILTSTPQLAAWTMMSADSRELLTRRGQIMFDYLASGVRQCGTLQGSIISHGTAERTEPRTGKSYLSFGWRKWNGQREHFGDVTNFRGFQLSAPYHWMNQTGSWEAYRERWNEIRRYFDVLPRRADWAIMGLDCMEDSANHQIDMGPDSWLGVLLWWKFAEGFGDRRDADFALYMAVKQVIPLITPYSRRPFAMSFDNTWDWEKQIPEAGWNERGVVIGCHWDTSAQIAYNGLGGCVWSDEEFSIYQTYCKEKMTEFLSRIYRHYPQWNDVTFKVSPKEALSKNTPNLQSQLIQLHELCGDTDENLLLYWRRGLAKHLPRPLWHHVSCSSISDLQAGISSLLIGRNTPVQLGWNHPAGILSGDFDPETGTSRIEFQSQVPFTADLVTDSAPSEVLMNGKPVENRRFSAAKRSLQVLCVPENGRVILEIRHPDWKAPERTPFQPVPTDIPLTEAMRLCKTEKERVADINAGDYQPTGKVVPIPLRNQYNMNFTPGAGSDAWMGENSGNGVTIQKGLQTFCGVPFEIGERAIGLLGHKARLLPMNVSRIPVGKRLKKLYFLHTTSYDRGNGELVMEYTIHCKGGKSFKVPVYSGEHIADWWSPRSLRGAKLNASAHSGSRPVGLYVQAWENEFDRTGVGAIAAEQLPYLFIERIDIRSSRVNGANVVFAISGEEE